jgi:hypothetical protein
MWSTKKEVLAEARTTQNEEPSHKQYNLPVATPLFPPNPGCSVSNTNAAASHDVIVIRSLDCFADVSVDGDTEKFFIDLV